jgi:hypothetical protein
MHPKNKNITFGGFSSKQKLLFHQASEGHDAW